ncbi:uncharacterized protein LOC131430320 isoform X2 [Malaya genurostris]|nr:uncharacterized protein LOC131430320 isoform X2 [Malaya genurostris]
MVRSTDASHSHQINTEKENKNENFSPGCSRSNRFLICNDVFESDLNPSTSVKNFIGKKLSSIIDNKVEFVDVDCGKLNETSSDLHRIQLLRDFYVSIHDLPEDETDRCYQISRQLVKANVNDDIEANIQLAAVDANHIVRESLQRWSNRPNRVYTYVGCKSNLILKDPVNEFTVMRQNNLWNESKISSFRKRCTK